MDDKRTTLQILEEMEATKVKRHVPLSDHDKSRLQSIFDKVSTGYILKHYNPRNEDPDLSITKLMDDCLDISLEIFKGLAQAVETAENEWDFDPELTLELRNKL